MTRVLSLCALLLALALPAAAQTTTTVYVTTTSKVEFDPSPEHDTTVVLGYKLLMCQRSLTPLVCAPVVDLGKPTKDPVTGKISVAGVFGGIVKNVEYVASVQTVIAGTEGPYSLPSNVFAWLLAGPATNVVIKRED